MYDLAEEYHRWLDQLDALNAEQPADEPTPPAAPRGRAYVRPADHAARLQQTVARIAVAPRYAHRSHRHQRGEE